MGKLKVSGKPFDISKREVWEAYEKVKANKGAPGVDGCSIDEFEKDLKNNLYKIWNRMSSGSYFPPPVLAVEIPKPHGGGTRILGVPTVADRIAQTVAARRLEEKVEPIFHPDSYGYRPARSALDAVGRCRERCWRYDWVIDLDIQKFFDSVPWHLIVKAVEAHTDVPWVVLYVKRWLAAPVRLPDGTLLNGTAEPRRVRRSAPVLANLFMHYAFDAWMAREFPTVPFERYADDAVVHCMSERQARHVRRRSRTGWPRSGCGCTRTRRRSCTARTATAEARTSTPAFTFLGFTFRQRRARNRHGKSFSNFLPAISKDALNKISAEVRSWRLHLRTGHTFNDLARRINPIVRRLDAVLRGVLPLRAVSAPATYQRLLDALDPQEVQTAAGQEEGPRVLAGDHREVPPHVRALEMGAFGPVVLKTRVTRAV